MMRELESACSQRDGSGGVANQGISVEAVSAHSAGSQVRSQVDRKSVDMSLVLWYDSHRNEGCSSYPKGTGERHHGPIVAAAIPSAAGGCVP
jgi:hypothetical protein